MERMRAIEGLLLSIDENVVRISMVSLRFPFVKSCVHVYDK